MQDVRIGIQTRSLRQPLRQALETAARLGADGVEIDVRGELPAAGMSQTGIRQFRKLLDDLNLKVSAAAFPTQYGFDVAENLERRVLATQAAMTFARQLGARVVVNRIGRVPEDASDRRFGRQVEVLTALAAHGTRAGTWFAAQTGTESGGELARLMAALPEGMVGVDLHPAGLIQNGFSPDEAVAALGPHVLHVHACDAVCDLAEGRTVEVQLGRGTADLPSLVGQLAQYNYRGWVTIERHGVADPVREIGAAVAFLRSL